MSRILKSLGLALAAMATMAAVTASAAHAETGVLTAAQYPAIITGEQEPGPTLGVGVGPVQSIECATSDLDGTIVGPTDPVTLTPTFAGCVSQPGATPVTITLNGCDYSFGVSRPGTTGTPPTTGKLQAWLLCPAGKQLEIHIYQNPAQHAANVSTCTYDIPPQGPVPAGIYHNTPGPPADVLATIDATFTALSTIGPEAICGGNAFQNIPITLTGSYTLRAYQDFGGVEGAQIPLDVG